MLEPYWGEFLVSPVPLELSLNYCSHKCAYCFANLSKPDRTANIKAITRFLRDYQQRDTYEARLLRAGYPVLFSNRVDPFAASNYKQSLPLIEMMVAMGIPISFQTKGGFGIDEAIRMAPRSCWYISMSMLDDRVRAAIEPGAPTIESRFDLMQKLIEAGHDVSLGLNPLVPEWLPEPEPLIDRCHRIGVRGAWIEALHLNRDQVANLTDREKSAMGAPAMADATKRLLTAAQRAHVDRADGFCRQVGIEPFGIGAAYRTNYWQGCRGVYQKTFPVMQDFINHCHDSCEPHELIFFDDFSDFMLPRLPSGPQRIRGYFAAKIRSIGKDRKIPQVLTCRQALSIGWHYPESKLSPCNVSCFAYARQGDDDLVDDDGMPVIAWVGNEVLDECFVQV